MKRNDPIKVTVLHQGAINHDHAYVYRASENVVAIAVDMKTKRGEIIATGNMDTYPTILLTKNEYSCHLNPDYDEEAPTELSFPEFPNWSIWCFDYSKYVLTLCLVR